MGLKHQESSRKRWDATGAEERARLGALHSAAVKKYWEGISVEERVERAAKAAAGRWKKAAV